MELLCIIYSAKKVYLMWTSYVCVIKHLHLNLKYCNFFKFNMRNFDYKLTDNFTFHNLLKSING